MRLKAPVDRIPGNLPARCPAIVQTLLKLLAIIHHSDSPRSRTRIPEIKIILAPSFSLPWKISPIIFHPLDWDLELPLELGVVDLLKNARRSSLISPFVFELPVSFNENAIFHINYLAFLSLKRFPLFETFEIYPDTISLSLSLSLFLGTFRRKKYCLSRDRRI